MVLVRPSPTLRDAFLEMAQDYEREGDSRLADAGRSFDDYLNWLEADRRLVDPGRVPQDVFWFEHHGQLVGTLSLRHYLTEGLENEGGHIGYSIRPSRRREGLGTMILGLGLVEAERMGIVMVRLTCDASNIGSAKIIERNGGRFDGREGDSHRRYWIDLRRDGTPAH